MTVYMNLQLILLDTACFLLNFQTASLGGQPMHKNDTLQMRIHTDDKEML